MPQADSLVMLAWAPGLIGFAVSGFMYGVTLGQVFYYARCFPRDPRFLKFLIFVIFLADTAHLIGGIQHYWLMLISCHRQYSPSCESGLSWGIMAIILLDIVIICVVQCFYCHRIWIISGRNRPLTGIVLAAALSELGLGIWLFIISVRAVTIRLPSTSPLILTLAGINVLGDFIITGTAFKYMWRSGFQRQRSIIQDMAVIFINMGALTCLISIIFAIMYLVQGASSWVIAVGIVASRIYVNSMLAVLNARRTIRDRAAAIRNLELSTVT